MWPLGLDQVASSWEDGVATGGSSAFFAADCIHIFVLMRTAVAPF